MHFITKKEERSGGGRQVKIEGTCVHSWLIHSVIWQKSTGHCKKIQFSSVHFVQSNSLVQIFATPQTAACLASLSITNSWSLLKLISIESVMPSNHLIFCHHLLKAIILELKDN